MNARAKEKKNKKRKNKESWFVLCDVTELHLWIERFCCSVGARPKTPATRPERRHRCWDFSPLRNDLLQDSRRGERGRSRLSSIDTIPPQLTPVSSVTRIATHTHSYLMWILWVCGSSVYVSLCCWTPCSCKYYCINAMDSQAHNEVCQQLGWEGEL